MESKSKLDSEYSKIINDNPDKKFILYLRIHPEDEKEKIIMIEISETYGEYKILQKERLAMFIVNGKKVNDFIDKLNSFDTQMYLSFIQCEDEINKT